MKFPTVTGSNLSGQRYHLPQDFEGQYNVAITVYQRFQQTNVDSWGALLQDLARQYPGLRYYELPTLPNYGWIQRSFIDGGMRGASLTRPSALAPSPCTWTSRSSTRRSTCQRLTTSTCC